MQQAQFNMLKQQINSWDVTDKHVLDVIADTPREDFVPKAFVPQAYADMMIPLGEGQVMMTPREEGQILQQVTQIKPMNNVLEVGTGSGYFTALLAKLSKHVVSVDIFPEFVEFARNNLIRQHIANINLQVGDAVQGWRKLAPYDVIVVTGSLPLLTDAFRHDLTIGGRLFVIVGVAPAMQALLITRTGKAKWIEKSLFETNIPALINAPQPAKFEF